MDKLKFSKNNTLALKGIAIIMMLLHHLFRKKSLYKNYTVSFFPLCENFVLEFSTMSKICVSFFAFITGYGLLISLKKLNEKYNWDRKQVFKWGINRIIKTLSGFWVIASLSYVVCQIIDGSTAQIFFEDGIIYGFIKIFINFSGLSELIGINNFNSSWWYMSIAILFILSVPVFTKLFKKYGYLVILLGVFIVPRIIGWEYVNSSYISFLVPLLLGIIFAENNLMVKIANAKICKNIYLSKIIKFIIETVICILLFYIFKELPQNKFWEIRYGIIPVFIICYLYEFFIDLPVINILLQFLGIHSLNIFLIHEFIRTNYLTDFIYSFGNWLKIFTVLFLMSLLISIIIEFFKKIIRYDKLIDKLQNFINKKIDEI